MRAFCFRKRNRRVTVFFVVLKVRFRIILGPFFLDLSQTTLSDTISDRLRQINLLKFSGTISYTRSFIFCLYQSERFESSINAEDGQKWSN